LRDCAVAKPLLTPQRSPLYITVLPPVCVAVLLFVTFMLYRSSYFSLDDFNNLYWVGQWTYGQTLQMLFSPSAEYFRPVGMLFYRIGLSLFGLSPTSFHALLWSIHTLNVALVYLALKQFVDSRVGAAAGALLFACPAVFSDIFHNFGTIFEVTGFALYLTGMMLWHRKERSFGATLLATAVFFMALKAKEMAITLPAIWVLQDLLLRRQLRWKQLLQVAIPSGVGVWFALQKVFQMSDASPRGPYYIDLQGLTMGRGFGFYFNMLSPVSLRWEQWAVVFTALLVLFIALRQWRAVLFQSYLFLAFLPLIFLVNHREFFYWYFPMFGVCGLTALAAQWIFQVVSRRVKPVRLAPYAVTFFAAVCVARYFMLRQETAGRRLGQHDLDGQYRGFVESLQRLPMVTTGETLYFKSVPVGFDAPVLEMAVAVALQRYDVSAQLVDVFPEGASLRLEFHNGSVRQIEP